MAKVRLVKGPFSGKVMDISGASGQTYVAVVGTKPMSRKQKYEWQRNQYQNAIFNAMPAPFPTVRAEYQIAMAAPGVPCQHPDGSYFYTYIEGSKKEY